MKLSIIIYKSTCTLYRYVICIVWNNQDNIKLVLQRLINEIGIIFNIFKKRFLVGNYSLKVCFKIDDDEKEFFLFA